MIQVLFCEADPQHQREFRSLVDEAVAGRPSTPQLEIVSDVPTAIAAAQRGVYPLVVVGDILPGAFHASTADTKRFPARELLEQAAAHNPSAVVAVLTTDAANVLSTLLELGIRGCLDKQKGIVNEPNLQELERLLGEVAGNFNCQYDLDLPTVNKYAFDGAASPEVMAKCETCLRRLFLGVNEPVTYSRMRRGRSGAGVLAAYVGNQVPRVFKFDAYKTANTEASNYRRFVQPYIQVPGAARLENAARAGDMGVLEYSYAGRAGYPATLADAILEQPADVVASALTDYFQKCCKRWYAGDGPVRSDLAAECRQHFGVQPDELNRFCHTGAAANVLATVAAFLGCSVEELVDTIVRSVRAEWANVRRRPVAIVHGDLNVNNLMWGDYGLCMIDFARTTDGAPRMFDFVRLEASIKCDVIADVELAGQADHDNLHQVLAIWDRLWRDLPLDPTITGELDDRLGRKIQAIKAVRDCAERHCCEPYDDYRMSLFYATAKYVQNRARDVAEAGRNQVPLAICLVCAYRLAKRIETYVGR